MKKRNFNPDIIPWVSAISTQTVHFKWMIAVCFVHLYEVITLSDDGIVVKQFNDKREIYKDTKYVKLLDEKMIAKEKKKKKSKKKVTDVFKNQMSLRMVIRKDKTLDSDSIDYTDTSQFRSIVIFMYCGTDEEKAGQLSVNILGSINTDEIYMTADLLLNQIIKKHPYVLRADFSRAIFDEEKKEYTFEEGALQKVNIVESDHDELMKIKSDDIEIQFDNIIINFRTGCLLELQNLEDIADDKFIFMMNDPKTNTVRFKFISSEGNQIHVHFKRTGRCNINKVKSIEEAEEALSHIYGLFKRHRYLLEITETQFDEMTSIEMIKGRDNIIQVMKAYYSKI